MAYIIGRNINVDDLNPNKVVGMSLLFNAGNVFNPVYATKEQIKANLINYTLTGQGERMLNPGYGLGLRNLIFESNNTISDREGEIKSKIQANFPQINILEFSLMMDDNYENTLLLNMTYQVSNTIDTITLGIQ
jgi:phage baseplate assembly protein W